MPRIVVDPITRIEGHLRIEAVVDNGIITDAFSSCTMVRGLEKILVGRDPRDAWAVVGRVCGVCTSIHSLTSVRAVEAAIGINVPKTAEIIRNIMECVLHIHDHVVHFYHLHALDWVDVINMLKADPKATASIAQSISKSPKNSPAYYAGVQERLKKFAESGQLGIFANGYWGHPQYKLPPEVNLIGVAHYLEALEWQKEIVKIHTVFGGKNPHPNFVVGGMPCSININEPNAINSERLNFVGRIIKEAIEFIENVYVPDVLAIAGFYKDWGAIGGGLENYLCYGDLPTRGYAHPEHFKFPRGVVLGRDLSTVHPVDALNPYEIKEYINSSWYSYKAGDDVGLHPFDGETNINYTGPKPPIKTLENSTKYSYIKTPRWNDKPMEVGPLSRMIVGYASGNTDVKELMHETLAKLDVPFDAMYSTLGRTAARALESKLVVHWLKGFYDELMEQVKIGETSTFNAEMWEPEKWPKNCEGVGLSEAPRGALAHYIKIEDGKIKNYQMVVPSTWNASPRDKNGLHSAFEASLIGTPVHDLDQPLEIIRTIHSFDPCISCSVHLHDPDGKHISQIKVE